MSAGIYKWTNLVNGNCYIGSSSVSVETRGLSHANRLRRGVHKNKHLQAAWNIYGEAAFTFEIIETFDLPAENGARYVEAREQFYIDSAAQASLYNICLTVAGSRYGVKMTETARKAISAKLKGVPKTEETKSKLSRLNAGQGLGRKLPRETCEKMSKSRQGRALSPEHLQAIRTAAVARRGKPLSEDHKRNLSAAQLRRFRRETKS